MIALVFVFFLLEAAALYVIGHIDGVRAGRQAERRDRALANQRLHTTRL